MLKITTEAGRSAEENGKAGKGKKPKRSLKKYLLEKMQVWINSLLEAERDEFLGRGRHEKLDEKHDNYRNGYRPRTINFFGLGRIGLRVPRDRKGGRAGNFGFQPQCRERMTAIECLMEPLAYNVLSSPTLTAIAPCPCRF